MGATLYRLSYASAAFLAAWRELGGGRKRIETANDRFKRRAELRLWVALPLATLVHGLAFALMPGPRPAPFEGTAASAPVQLLAMPPEVRVPSPPAELARPATPVLAEIDVSAELTIPAVSFADIPEPYLPPLPPTPSVAELLPGYEHLTRFVVAPELKNRARVLRALDASYPASLLEAGIGGEVLIWCWIDRTGAIRQFEIKRSSGYRELDAAAASVVALMEFRPAVHRGEAVRVIVALPIVFQRPGRRVVHGLSG